MTGLQTNIRVRAEGSGVILKPIVIILVLLYDTHIQYGDGRLALVAFALGQLAYAATLFCVYQSHYGGVLMPKPIRLSSRRRVRFVFYSGQKGVFRINNPSRESDYFEPDSLRLSLTITVQSIFKQILTEGDKLILTWLSPLHDQGGYALAVNYGTPPVTVSTMLKFCSELNWR